MPTIAWCPTRAWAIHLRRVLGHLPSDALTTHCLRASASTVQRSSSDRFSIEARKPEQLLWLFLSKRRKLDVDKGLQEAEAFIPEFATMLRVMLGPLGRCIVFVAGVLSLCGLAIGQTPEQSHQRRFENPAVTLARLEQELT